MPHQAIGPPCVPDVMSIAAHFERWLADGQPFEKRPERDLSIPNAINSVLWSKLVTHARSTVLKSLSKELEQAAKQHGQTSKDAVKRWKEATARKFFFVLPEALQDELTDAGPALRSGLMDEAAARVLRVEWTRPDTAAEPASSSKTCWPEEEAASSKAARNTAMQRRKMADDLVARVVEGAKSADDAMAVMTLVQKRLANLYRRVGECSCRQWLQDVSARCPSFSSIS